MTWGRSLILSAGDFRIMQIYASSLSLLSNATTKESVGAKGSIETAYYVMEKNG
jgi:hypothetical protein